MSLSLKQLIKSGFTTRQAKALQGLGAASASGPSPVLVLYNSSAKSALVSTFFVPFSSADVQDIADWTGIPGYPALDGVEFVSGYRVNVPDDARYDISWGMTVLFTTDTYDGQFLEMGCDCTGVSTHNDRFRVPIIGAKAFFQETFTEYVPNWGVGGYNLRIGAIRNAAGDLTGVPADTDIHSQLIITKVA